MIGDLELPHQMAPSSGLIAQERAGTEANMSHPEVKE